MKQQSGFTLIELIAVIVILGIIAAVAVPRFVDLSGAAEDAAVKGVAANLASASSLNYAAYVANEAGVADAPDYVGITSCEEADNALQGSGLSSQYIITGSASIGTGASADCTVSFSDGEATPAADTSKAQATFTAIGVPAP